MAKKNRNRLGLTPRQVEFIQLILDGYKNKEIAFRCGVSHRTVRVILNLAYKNLSVSDRLGAVKKCLKHGIIYWVIPDKPKCPLDNIDKSILSLIYNGMTYYEISDRVGMEINSIKRRVRGMKNKWNNESVIQLCLIAKHYNMI